MPLSADKKTAKGDCGSGVTKFVQSILVQHVEFLARFHDDQLAGGGNAEQPAINPDGRTEKAAIPGYTFLVADRAGRRVHAREDAAVTPEPNQIPHANSCRHVGRGFLQLVGEFRFAAGHGSARLDGRNEIPATTTPTGPENDIAGDDWGTDTALVKRLVVLPDDFARISIDGVNAMALAVENQRGLF